MKREKRTGDLKIYVPPTLEEKLEQLAQRERRSKSAYCYQVLEEHVALAIVKQQIGGPRQVN